VFIEQNRKFHHILHPKLPQPPHIAVKSPLTTGGTVEDNEEPIRIPITDVFDLHTFQPKEVAAAVEAYLEEAHRLGLKALRIIHGRGMGVQRQIVRAVLARTPFVIGFGDAPPEAGGWGATIVRLR
jgi:dsDNA-specific endonuclease/ATPase MutS2